MLNFQQIVCLTDTCTCMLQHYSKLMILGSCRSRTTTRSRQDRLLFSVFIVISNSSLRDTYIQEILQLQQNYNEFRKKNPVLKTGSDKMYVNKHSYQSCICNDLKGSAFLTNNK